MCTQAVWRASSAMVVDADEIARQPGTPGQW
jgi:hypothetical protein